MEKGNFIITPTSGDLDADITITAKENTEITTKESSIKIISSAEGGGGTSITRTVTLTQNAADKFIWLYDSKFTVVRTTNMNTKHYVYVGSVDTKANESCIITNFEISGIPKNTEFSISKVTTMYNEFDISKDFIKFHNTAGGALGSAWSSENYKKGLAEFLADTSNAFNIILDNGHQVNVRWSV